MKPRVTTCKAVGCQQAITEPLLMCVEHWRMVPAALRRQVWGSYHRLRHEPTAHGDHLAAVKAAVDAVHQKCQARKNRADAATRNLF